MQVFLFLIGAAGGFVVFYWGFIFFQACDGGRSDSRKDKPFLWQALEAVFYAPFLAFFNPFPFFIIYLFYMGYKLSLGKLYNSWLWFFLGMAFTFLYLFAKGRLITVTESIRTPITLDDLEGTFGAKVVEIVKGASEPDKSVPWEERKQHTIDFLKEASQDLKFVALADKLHNISAIANDYAEIGEKLWDRFKRGKEAQEWYYRGLVEALHDDSADEEYRKLYRQFDQKMKEVFGDK